MHYEIFYAAPLSIKRCCFFRLPTRNCLFIGYGIECRSCVSGPDHRITALFLRCRAVVGHESSQCVWSATGGHLPSTHEYGLRSGSANGNDVGSDVRLLCIPALGVRDDPTARIDGDPAGWGTELSLSLSLSIFLFDIVIKLVAFG